MLDGGYDEDLAELRKRHELAEPARALVPAADSQQRLEALVVLLEAVELGIAACECLREEERGLRSDRAAVPCMAIATVTVYALLW